MENRTIKCIRGDSIMENYYDAADQYGCFEGLYFEFNDGVVGLAEDELATGWTGSELNKWLSRVEKYVIKTLEQEIKRRVLNAFKHKKLDIL
jgi:hypothetical protein